MHPILLIAEREFRTYVATLSFWVALAIAPAMAGIAFFLFGAAPVASMISIESNSTALSEIAGRAVLEAGRVEGRAVIVGSHGPALYVSFSAPADIVLTFDKDFPLSPAGRAMAGYRIERDMTRLLLPAANIHVRRNSPQADEPDGGRISRLAAMTMLWLTLTGSLGMLLQAIVRERANRALESLLASARATQIVWGKILGVGLVSLLVLLAWCGTAFAMALSVAKSSPLFVLLTSFSDFPAVARIVLIYVCAFAFYGAVTLAVGALARDSASAQNLARPMFVCLLCGFLAALFGSDGSAAAWLMWFPPFTPFLLVAKSSGSVALISQFVLLSVLASASVLTVFVAARCLTFSRTTSTSLFARHVNYN